MLRYYAQWITRWEHKLATRDNNRVVRPFEWGLEWLDGLGGFRIDPGKAPADAMEAYVAAVLADSGRFYAYRTPDDYKLHGERLTFTSPVESPSPVNNTVHGQYFPAPNSNGRAVLVLPQWNSDAGGHVGLCKLLNRFGVSALRMSMAYHDYRMPPELERADYHVSSNLGRTMHASRQSVIDARASLDWLEQQGYTKLGILGTSLGSCVAFIAAAHDLRIATGVFNHVSTYFSDVVWTGLSTQHVRRGFTGDITQDTLRRYWSIISPASYMDRLQNRELKNLLIWARFDSSFLPVYSKQVLEQFRKRSLHHKVFALPCGHYTTGQFPFKIMDGLAMCRFLGREM